MNDWPGNPGEIKGFDEIVAVIKQERQEPLSFVPEVLADFLTVEESKEMLQALGKDVGDTSEWEDGKPRDRETIVEAMREYMERIGWPKVEDHRGLSAGRTVQKMSAWVWLAGDEGVLKEVFDRNYSMYGAPILAGLCEHYGWPIPDSGAVQKMIRSEPCGPDCWGCSN